MAKNTHVKARNANNEISVSHSEVDTPLLDIKALERLHQFRPDIVDFIVEETKKEAESRRKREQKIDWFIFIEKIGALLLATLVACGGIFGSIYAGIQGFERLSWIIAGTCIGSLAVAFLRRTKNK